MGTRHINLAGCGIPRLTVFWQPKRAQDIFLNMAVYWAANMASVWLSGLRDSWRAHLERGVIKAIVPIPQNRYQLERLFH
ncbi:hypothetical protein DD563_02025 [Pelagicola sp. LXJ1103]|nr:hypothetical protein DD563_02025 [Pelagicola sp. LXJ1103]